MKEFLFPNFIVMGIDVARRAKVLEQIIRPILAGITTVIAATSAACGAFDSDSTGTLPAFVEGGTDGGVGGNTENDGSTALNDGGLNDSSKAFFSCATVDAATAFIVPAEMGKFSTVILRADGGFKEALPVGNSWQTDPIVFYLDRGETVTVSAPEVESFLLLDCDNNADLVSSKLGSFNVSNPPSSVNRASEAATDAGYGNIDKSQFDRFPPGTGLRKFIPLDDAGKTSRILKIKKG